MRVCAAVVGGSGTPGAARAGRREVGGGGHAVVLRRRSVVAVDRCSMQIASASSDGETAARAPGCSLHVDEVLGAQQHRELAEVHLGDHHPVVALQHLAEVGRERVEVAQVGLGDVRAGVADPAGRRPRSGRRSSPSRAPGRLASPRRVVDLERRDDRRRCRRPWPGAGADHEVVVGGVVGDVAVPVGLLEAADAVLEARRAGDRPRPGEGLLVAQVGPELARRVDALGSVAKSGSIAGQRRPRRGSATARSRWRGSRRTAGSPACGR